MLKAIQHLAASKADAVIVGSAALWLLGIQGREPKDLDIVVQSLSDIEGHITAYETDSPFSLSGKRAFSILPDGLKIDIFVECYLPAYTVQDGVKIETPAAMLSYYRELLPRAREHWHQGIKEKIKILSSWMEKI